MPAVTPATPTNPQPLPVNRYAARSSYYGTSGYQMSEGLKRARRPFRAKNALTGLAIMGFAVSVYTYSMRAVKQDDFSDLPTTSSAAGKEGVKTIEEELAEKAKAGGARGIGAMMGLGSSPQGEGARIDSASSQQVRAPVPQPTPLSTPLPPSASSSTASSAAALSGVRPSSRFIVGAPDVDRLGKLADRSQYDGTIDGRRVV